MNYLTVCVILAVSPFAVMPLAAAISDHYRSGYAGAAIPGLLFGLIYGACSWAALIVVIIFRLFT